MTIQRYTGENVEFHTTGDLVAYEDYAELKEEYERLDKSHSAALAKIDALVAELGAVDAVHNEAVFITDEDYDRCPKRVQDIIRHLAVMQVPAYRSFVSSLRAEGVEMFAYYISIYNSDAEMHAHSFAAQLRSKSEAQS